MSIWWLWLLLAGAHAAEPLPPEAQVEAVVAELTVLSQQQDYPEMRALAEQSLEEMAKAHGKDHPALLQLHEGIGLASLYLRELPAAEQAFLRALELVEAPEHGAVPDEARLSMYLGRTLGDQGRFEESLALLLRAVALLEGVDGLPPEELAEPQVQLGSALRRMGQLPEARGALERALQLAGEVEAPLLDAVRFDALRGLLDIASSLSDLEHSRRLAARLREVAVAMDGPGGRAVAFALEEQAKVHHMAGELDEALARYDEARAILAAHGVRHPMELAGIDHASAMVLMSQGRSAEALERFEQVHETVVGVLGPSNHQVGTVLTFIGRLHLDLDQYDEAEAALSEALTLIEATMGPRSQMASVLHRMLGSVAKHREDPVAHRAHRDANLAISTDQLALLDHMSEREALAHLPHARTALEDWLWSFKGPEDARAGWEHVLQWKGIATRRARARRVHAFLQDPQAKRLFTELGDLKRSELALRGSPAHTVPDALEALAVELDRVERELAQQSAAWRAHHGASAATAEEICAAIPRSAALVDYVKLDFEQDGAFYTAFVVRPDCSVTRVALGAAEPIDAAATSWLFAMNHVDLTGVRVQMRGQTLRSQVFDPLLPALAGVDQLILVPDGELAVVAVGALPQASGRYLLEDYLIQTTGDAHALAARREPTRAAGLLAVGDVSYAMQALGDGATREGACEEQNLPALPATRAEVRTLRRRWRSGRHRAEPVAEVAGEDAREAQVIAQLPGKRVVHLATHGFYSDACAGPAGAASGVVLADGVLTAEEVALLELGGTELVVLSACESGLGERTDGSGVLGLQRSFSIAGAEAVIMSLWKVEDAATSTLMERFYRRLLSRRSPTSAQALRAAQLEMLTEDRALGVDRPWRWGAFVLAGRVE